MRLVPLPERGAALPRGIDPEVDCCEECGDLLAWCPIWVRRWPSLETFRD